MIRILADPGALSRAAAELFGKTARQAAGERGRFSVALSGGSTPQATYRLLAAPPLRDQIPWAQVHVFWGDERCVPADDLRSNARMAREALLDHVPIPPGQIHPLVCTADPVAAARASQRQLEEFFAPGPPRFDLVLLGLGSDGHTASLFPGSPVLAETERWLTRAQRPGDDFCRLTLTLPLINRAAKIVFLVTGADKAPILRQVLNDEAGPRRFPAQLVRPQNGKLIWLVDRAAGGLTDPA